MPSELTTFVPQSRARQHLRLRKAWALLFVVAVVFVLSLMPVLRLIQEAFFSGGTWNPDNFTAQLQRNATLIAGLHTLETSLFGALLSMVIGMPLAVATTMTDIPWRRSLGFLLLLPLMIAPQVTALSWMHAFGPSSPLLNMLGIAPPPGTPNPIAGRNGIILLFGVQHAPIVFITMRAGLARIPRDLIEAARVSGAHPIRALATITFPLIRPYMVAACALAFVSGVGNFGIPALLGMPVNYFTLPTLVYQRLASFGPTVLPQVASLSVMIGVIALMGVLLQSLAMSKASYRFTIGSPVRIALGRWRWPLALLAWAVLAITLIVPAVALFATSLVPSFGVPLNAQTVTLSNYTEILFNQASTQRALINSTMLAGGAAIVLAIGVIPLVLAMEGLPKKLLRFIDASVELPYALPGIVLALACILLFLAPLPLIGSLYATAAIIFVAYLMRFFPLALKPVATAINQMAKDLEEAAAVSGAGRTRRILTIVLPIVAPSAMAAALLVFMSAFNELTVSALLWSSRNETLGVILFSLEEAGLSPQAAALGIVTVIAVVIILIVIDRLGRKLPDGILPWR
ncbi:ABC transporter permease [Limoniibacter endophyticus]|nr:iron ABC transporter permease [Limoniibacter endophyticus]